MSPLCCAACRASVRRAVFCASCLAPHHTACLVAAGACACGERLVVRPARLRHQLRPGLLALGVVAITAAAALRATSDVALRLDDAGTTAARLDRAAIAREADALVAARVARARALLDEPRRVLDVRIAAAPELAGILAGAAIEDARRVLAGEPELTEHDEAAAQVTYEIDALFVEIILLAEERRVEELIERFTRLRRLMVTAAEHPGLVRRLEGWNRRIAELGEVTLSVKLQVFISEGNRLLRFMADALSASSLPRVEAGYAAALTVCAEMRLDEREVYHRNAEALELRARALVDRGRELRRQLREQR